jgi:hypothetical protein
MRLKRNRITYTILVMIVIVLGLLSRKFMNYFTDWINLFLGDALWALMVYLIIGTILNKIKIGRLAFYSIAFCYLIEISELYHAPWIDAIRNTTIGGLVLGFGFLWSDIMAYAIGVGLGVGIEYLILVGHNK